MVAAGSHPTGRRSPAPVDPLGTYPTLLRTILNPHESMHRITSLCIVAAACAAPAGSPPEQPVNPPAARVGVLVMAHGGDADWNRSVIEAVEPLQTLVPTAVAFGMADPLSLDQGLRELRTAGTDRVVVVRMFLSGESFAAQTNYLLGLTDSPPENFVLMGEARALGAEPSPISHGLVVATHDFGIMRSPEAAKIVAHRARQLSTEPGQESVLLVAHGMGDEAANDRVLESMRAAAAETASAGFADIRVATLREDWMEKRSTAENDIRRYVRAQTAIGRRVIVVPYRLSGFGPYAEVLDGTSYVAAEGLLPHPRLSDWVTRTAAEVMCIEGWGDVLRSCGPGDTASIESVR